MEMPVLLSQNATKSAANLMNEMSRLFFLARAIHVVAEFDIADHIGDGVTSITNLSKCTGTDASSLNRLLRFLSSYAIFLEVEPGEFRNTDLSNVMRQDHSDSIRPLLRRFGEEFWASVGQMEHSIITGNPTFERVVGMSRFEYMKNNPDLQKRFDEGMAKMSETEDSAIAGAYDFQHFRQIVDVGGGRGGLLAQILTRTPNARGVLFDQPQVLAQSILLNESSLSERCELIGGDFFQFVPSGGDCYIMKDVLHDFNDDQCVTILSNCRNAVSPGGRIIIAGRDLPTSLSEPHLNLIMDVHMMTLHGGRERTLPEWISVIHRAGLQYSKSYHTDVNFTLVEAITE